MPDGGLKMNENKTKSQGVEVTTCLQNEYVLVQQCRNGSRDAFEPIVNRYMKDSYYIALGLVGSHDDALELSQEAFYHAYRNIKQLNSERKFSPWFYQILRNLCFTHLRKRKRRQEHLLENIEDIAPAPAPEQSFAPDTLAQNTETKQAVWKAIGRVGRSGRLASCYAISGNEIRINGSFWPSRRGWAQTA